MSQPRDDDTDSNAVPWLTDSRPWSLSISSSISAMPTPAGPSNEGTTLTISSEAQHAAPQDVHVDMSSASSISMTTPAGTVTSSGCLPEETRGNSGKEKEKCRERESSPVCIYAGVSQPAFLQAQTASPLSVSRTDTVALNSLSSKVPKPVSAEFSDADFLSASVSCERLPVLHAFYIETAAELKNGTNSHETEDHAPPKQNDYSNRNARSTAQLQTLIAEPIIIRPESTEEKKCSHTNHTLHTPQPKPKGQVLHSPAAEEAEFSPTSSSTFLPQQKSFKSASSPEPEADKVPPCQTAATARRDDNQPELNCTESGVASTSNEDTPQQRHRSPSQLPTRCGGRTANPVSNEAPSSSSATATATPINSQSTSRASSMSHSVPAQKQRKLSTTTADAKYGVHWVSCDHSDPPARYRDTPAYYCTYCSYTVCEACCALIPSSLLEGKQQQQQRNNSDTEEKVKRRPLRKKQQHRCRITEADQTAVREEDEGDAGRDEGTETALLSTHNKSCASSSMDWLDEVLNSPSTAVCRGKDVRSTHPIRHTSLAVTATAQAAQEQHRTWHSHERSRHTKESKQQCKTIRGTTPGAPPPLCHLCRRGHFLREEALLHEWCCEGPDPPLRKHRSHALVYDTQNLQKYHFMRAQRETRLASTAPLSAQVLSVSSAALPFENRSLQEGSQAREEHVALGGKKPSLTLHQIHVRGNNGHKSATRRDPLPMPSAGTASHHPTRRSAAASLQEASSTLADAVFTRRNDTVRRAHSRRHHLRSIPASPSLSSSHVRTCACEEGGSFVFSVRNPRLETSLVWCAVNREPREETPAYASALTSSNNAGGGVLSSAASSSSSITPLLLWRCPPSLPGLPARPYRVVVPYGLYAFANVHALTLYVASDIFRKATAQLVGCPVGTTNGNDGGGSMPWLDSTEGSVFPLPFQQRQQQQQHLALMKVAPSASLRPLLTVTILHHIATTPRPILFPSYSVQQQRKRGRTPDSPQNTAQESVQGEKKSDAKLLRTATPLNLPDPNMNKREKDEDRINEVAGPQLQWPDGLASAELALCLDHLLHGRSVAVYGVASKFFFLQHVANSAALQPFTVVTVDASFGRANATQKPAINSNNNSGTISSSAYGGGRRSYSFAGGGAVSHSSVTRQLLSVGHMLGKRLSGSTILTAEMRARMATAAANAEVVKRRRRERKAVLQRQQLPYHTTPSFDDDENTGEEEKHGDAGADVARAALRGDVGRSPSLARDVTIAVLQRHSSAAAVDVVDVDSTSGASSTTDTTPFVSSSEKKESGGKQTKSGVAAPAFGNITPPKGTVRETLPFVSETPPNSASNNNNINLARTGSSSPSSSAVPVVVSPFESRASQLHTLSGCTPASQRVTHRHPSTVHSCSSVGCGAMTQLESPQSVAAAAALSPPLSSPIPAFFAALQRTVSGEDEKQNSSDEKNVMGVSSTNKDNDSVNNRRQPEDEAMQRVTCTELPDFFGELNSLRMPNRFQTNDNAIAAASATAVDVRWKPPHVTYANDAVRRYVLQTLRRRHVSRRCLQWASLPSTTAATQLSERTRKMENGTKPFSLPSLHSPVVLSPTMLLTRAHQTRPGWQPPVLLVLHNVDLLEGEEVNVFLQLCAQFAFPYPHLQLLLSFDNPLWPLSPVAAALERLGVCAVQLRSLLLPRVHEMRHVSSIHLLTDFEAAAATAGGSTTVGTGGRVNRRGRMKSAVSTAMGRLPAGISAARAAGGGSTLGTSHLLQDTMRRVLFSLPPAFNSLLRILLDLQDEVGEGVFISLFTVAACFEQNGVMVSQGRLKALLRELTSNRIARYDSAEHALMVPQVGRLRKVLEEVTAQREDGGGGPAR